MILEELEDIAREYPIGSKVVCNGNHLGYGSNEKDLVCKVLGYSRWGYGLLLYNPDIIGHSGNNYCLNGLHEEVDQSYLERNYRESCWYINYDMVKKV